MRRRGPAAREVERGSLAALALNYRREVVGVVLATAATLTIFINALFLQHGPHPAPFFATRPLVKPVQPVRLPSAHAIPQKAAPEAAPQIRAQLIANIQRELTRHDFYDGADDGIWGTKTDAAARDFAQAAGLKINVEANEALLRALSTSTVRAKSRAVPPVAALNDPIAKLLAPSTRVLAVQRALADFGYGQIKPTGVYDADTRTAIETFQRDRRLPVSGDISDELVRELAAVTGRPLE